MKHRFLKAFILICGVFIAMPAYSQLQVWPGDANNDGVVNTLDALYIGRGYNTQGIARNTQGIVWQANTVGPWANVLSDSTNYAFLDCDGNGFVNEDDLIAVSQNYGLTHGNGTLDTFPAPDTTSPIFYFSGLPDSLNAGEVVNIHVYAGTNTAPATFFGLSFRFLFDTTYVVSDSIFVTPDSLLNSPTDRLLVLSTFSSGGLDVALSKRANSGGTSGTPMVLAGQKVATISFIIEDNLIGKTAPAPLDIRLADIHMLSQSLGKTSAENVGTSIPFTELVAVTPSPALEEIKIYPQPTAGLLVIEGLKSNGAITLTDLSGRQVLQQPVTGSLRESLDCSAIAPGVYLLHIQTQEGSAVRKILVD